MCGLWKMPRRPSSKKKKNRDKKGNAIVNNIQFNAFVGVGVVSTKRYQRRRRRQRATASFFDAQKESKRDGGRRFLKKKKKTKSFGVCKKKSFKRNFGRRKVRKEKKEPFVWNCAPTRARRRHRTPSRPTNTTT